MTEEVIAENAVVHRLSFMDSFIGTLSAPTVTFRRLSQECYEEVNHLVGAVCIVVLVFGLDALRITPANEIKWAVLNVPLEITGGLTLWLLSAGIASLTALCFGVDIAKTRAAFVTMAWSLAPWIFMGPIACFWKILGASHVLFMAVPLLWILILQIIAIKESFQMKVWQALVFVLVIPPLLSWFQLMQFAQSLAATFGSLFP